MGYEQLPRELEECLDKSSLYIKMTKSGKLSSYLFYAIHTKNTQFLKIEEYLEILDKGALKIVKKKILEQNPTNKVVNDEIVSNVKKSIRSDLRLKRQWIEDFETG